jgi:hypothetical protein
MKSYPDPDNLKPGSLLFTLTETVSDIRKMLRKHQPEKLATPLWLIVLLLTAGLCLALWILWTN